jgi:DNA-binding MarR family transcriptional regulator
MTDDMLILDDFLPYRLNRLADAVSREFSTIYKERYGLTRPEWRTLATVGQFGSITATAVSAHSTMHKTKVSRAVAELERRRWLLRRTDPNDRRIEHLTLTPAGERVYRELVPVARDFEARFLAQLKGGDRAAAARVLTLLEQAAGVRAGAGPSRTSHRRSPPDSR